MMNAECGMMNEKAAGPGMPGSGSSFIIHHSSFAFTSSFIIHHSPLNAA
jgi:hypothetical protein